MENPLNKLSKKVKTTIGIGAVVAGAGVGLGSALNQSLEMTPEKEQEMNQFYRIQSTETTDNVQNQLNGKFKTQLDELGFKKLEIVFNATSRSSTVLYIVFNKGNENAIKEQDLHEHKVKFSPEQKVLVVGVDNEIMDNRYSLEDFLSNAVSKELSRLGFEIGIKK